MKTEWLDAQDNFAERLRDGHKLVIGVFLVTNVATLITAEKVFGPENPLFSLQTLLSGLIIIIPDTVIVACLINFWLTPVHLYCEHCDCHIPSNQDWTCGFCQQSWCAEKAWLSFLSKCDNCKRLQNSYECPDCGTLQFLNAQRDPNRPARKHPRTMPKIKAKNPEDENHARDLNNIRREIERDQLLIEKTNVKASLKIAAQRLDPIPLAELDAEEEPDPIEEELAELQRVAEREEKAADWWDRQEKRLRKKWTKRQISDQEIRARLSKIIAAVAETRRRRRMDGGY